MKSQNCGTIALAKLKSLESISIGTLIALAKDNGLILFPYQVDLSDLQNIPFPSIVHYQNHFELIDSKEELNKSEYILTGIFISEHILNFPLLDESLYSISGQSWVAAGIASAGLTLQLGSSIVKNHKAKQIAKANVRPDYTPNPEILQNADLAASRANTGLSDASKTLYGQENERNLSQSLDAILRSGGEANQVADLYANNTDALLKLAAMDSNLQSSNVNAFIGANAAKGSEIQSAWQINEFAPYNDRAQLAALLRMQSQQELNNAIQTGQQGAAQYSMATMYKPKKEPTTKDANYDDIEGAFNQANMNYTPQQSRTRNPNDVYGRDYMDTPSQRYIDAAIKAQLGNEDPLNQYNQDLFIS